MVESILKKIDKIIDVWAGFLQGQVFYIPTLGPVYTSGNSVKTLLRDVLNNSQTDNFLPYDKDKRWHKDKKEKIILSKILIDNCGFFVPVKSNFKNNVLKIFYYTKNTIDNAVIKKIKRIAADLKNIEKADKCFLYCFEKPKNEIKFTCHDIYLKIINEAERIVEVFIENVYKKNKIIKIKKKVYYVFGKLMVKDFSGDVNELKDFKKVKINNEIFCPLLARQYLEWGIVCYKMKPI